jgi:hypothetical protein
MPRCCCGKLAGILPPCPRAIRGGSVLGDTEDVERVIIVFVALDGRLA